MTDSLAAAVDRACDAITRTRKGGFMGGNFEESVRAGVVAAAPALLAAIVGAMPRPMQIVAGDVVTVGGWPVQRNDLLAALTAALARLAPPAPHA